MREYMQRHGEAHSRSEQEALVGLWNAMLERDPYWTSQWGLLRLRSCPVEETKRKPVTESRLWQRYRNGGWSRLQH